MSDWFSKLGEPITPDARRTLLDYVRGLGITPNLELEQVSSWTGARRIITNTEWDRRFWEAEQLEKRRLFAKARAQRGAPELVLEKSCALETSAAVHGAAALEATRAACTDVGLIGAAAGAASEALFLAELAELAGECLPHPFLLKKSLFAAGHWPLGALGGRYYVF
jgi:hypothetical protein